MGILGPLVIEDSSRAVQIGGARLRSLFTRLAADPGRWVSANALAAALWPDDDAPGDQANALQSLVSRLRRALPDPQLIESGPAGYRLQLSTNGLDATRFEAAAAAARRDLAAGSIAAGAELLREALALWRGPALDDVPQLPFVVTWATRLEELRLSAIEDRVDADLALGHQTGLVPELEELVAANPLRERLHGQLIRALARTGRQGDALKAYDRVRRVLADELGVDPSPALKAVHLAVLRSEDSGEPEPSVVRPRAVRRTNLRPALTSFVGREDDIAQVTGTIHRSRLVTLVGAGGSGKTRLSVEVAWRLDDCGRDGIWQAELAPISDPEGLAAAALGAIGTLDSTRMDTRVQAPRRDDLQRLVETIGDRDIVLLLDNCEHVIDAAAKLADLLLGECPSLKIIATSREPLGITGESLWPVQPLVTPGADNADLAGLQASSAVQLFVDRGALVRPGFTLTAENAGAVREICRRLDGLPLAIELAAARLRTMSAQSIAARLQDRFRLLTGGSRTAMPRHQTLRAVVAWSWDLLTDTERELTERLSVFPGGATVEAAAAVATIDGDDIPTTVDDDLLDRLTALADKSLLVAVDGDAPRYRMLETIREFSGERLAERGQIQPVRAAFVRYFLELAEAAEPRLRSRDQLAAMTQLNNERENLMAAIRFAADAGDAASAVRISAGLSWYWTLLGRHDEATGLLSQALAVPGEVPPQAYLIALITFTINSAAIGWGMPTQSDIDTLVALADRLDPYTSHPLVSLIRPAMAVFDDDREAVVAAIERLGDHQDPWALAMLHMIDVVSAENAGDIQRVREVAPAALAEFRAIGDRWGTGTALQALSSLHGLDGDVDGAIAALEEARTLMGELRATDDATYAEIRIGILMLQSGGPSASTRAYLERALLRAEDSGAPHGMSFAFQAMALLSLAEGDRAAAWTWANRGYDLIGDITVGPPQVLAVSSSLIAHLQVLDGKNDLARRQLEGSWGITVGSRDMPVVSRVMTVAAEVARALGETDLAALVVGAGERARGGPDLGDPDLLLLIGQLRDELGDERYQEQHRVGHALDQAAAIALVSDWLGVDTEPHLRKSAINMTEPERPILAVVASTPTG